MLKNVTVWVANCKNHPFVVNFSFADNSTVTEYGDSIYTRQIRHG
jgi:hypothetical protein